VTNFSSLFLSHQRLDLCCRHRKAFHIIYSIYYCCRSIIVNRHIWQAEIVCPILPRLPYAISVRRDEVMRTPSLLSSPPSFFKHLCFASPRRRFQFDYEQNDKKVKPQLANFLGNVCLFFFFVILVELQNGLI